ncbi:MFS transporter [Paenibacillus albicereus]|uniref:MFS transporter n=1 Tax=Paenibacillus albicereus TaxID=2726185 RepID=A0A6H2GTJ9_9BACL|nr:MFS transporter [Paenibacillus albicereus]QJC50715.1 MFS transporter [Paenibacillus albicereus]
MKTLFRNPTFCRLFFASVASQLGNVVGNMALAFYFVDRFSSQPALATTAELMYSLPTLAVFWLVGVAADRFDRQRIAAWSDWIRAGLTVLLLLFVLSDLFFLTFLTLFLRSAISKFFGPAEMGLLQSSIEPDQYVQASGLNQMVLGLFMLFGMSLGATAYQFIGIEGAILLDGISFIVSGLLIGWGKFDEKARVPNGAHRLRELRFPLIWQDFREGLRYIAGNRLLVIVISGFLFFGVVNGVFAVLPLFAMKYGLSPETYVVHSSLITVFLGIGVLAGSLLGPTLIRRFSRTRTLIAGLFLAGALIGGLGLAERVEVYFALMLIAGIAIAPINIALGSWIPELVPPQSMGRVNALIEPVLMLGQSMALGIIALAFPAWISVTWLHYGLAAITVGVSTFYLSTLPAMVRSREAVRAEA